MTVLKKPKCLLCRSSKNIGVLITEEGSVKICKSCNEQPLLTGLYDYEKVRAINEGFIFAKENKLYLPYAINVSLGRYNLSEAKRKTKLREMELNGRHTDAYGVGKRLSGSFQSAK